MSTEELVDGVAAEVSYVSRLKSAPEGRVEGVALKARNGKTERDNFEVWMNGNELEARELFFAVDFLKLCVALRRDEETAIFKRHLPVLEQVVENRENIALALLEAVKNEHMAVNCGDDGALIDVLNAFANDFS